MRIFSMKYFKGLRPSQLFLCLLLVSVVIGFQNCKLASPNGETKTDSSRGTTSTAGPDLGGASNGNGYGGSLSDMSGIYFAASSSCVDPEANIIEVTSDGRALLKRESCIDIEPRDISQELLVRSYFFVYQSRLYNLKGVSIRYFIYCHLQKPLDSTSTSHLDLEIYGPSSGSVLQASLYNEIYVDRDGENRFDTTRSSVSEIVPLTTAGQVFSGVFKDKQRFHLEISSNNIATFAAELSMSSGTNSTNALVIYSEESFTCYRP